MAGSEGASARPVVIHIGWHKSASTYLQNGFFRSLGANYQPLAAFPPGNDYLVREHGSLIDFAESPERFDAARFRAVLESPDAAMTVISHEEISGHPHGYPLIDPIVTARNLAAAYPGARIIAITRNQFDYILSLYCYRVGIRGHESRSLARFVREELAAGLQEHIQYDRVVGEYVRLFGTDNVLVLPMEMLRHDRAAFFERLERFVGRSPDTLVDPSTVNVSTRHAFVVALWRPLNAAFAWILRVALRAQGEDPAKHEPQVRKVYPFLPARYRYYAFKRRVTGWLTRMFPTARRITPADIPDRARLEGMFATANARLQALGVIDWDMAAYGYASRANSR